MTKNQTKNLKRSKFFFNFILLVSASWCIENVWEPASADSVVDICVGYELYSISNIGGFKRGKGPCYSNLAPNKPHERPCAACRMHENHLAAGAPPRIRMGSPRPPSWWGAGGYPLRKNGTSLSALLTSDLAPDPKYESWPLPT